MTTMTKAPSRAAGMTIEKALPKYQEWMEAIGKAPKTIHNNITTINAWMLFSKTAEMAPADISEKYIGRWINNPKDEAGARTRAVNLASLRVFFRFLVSKGWSDHDPAALVRVNMDNLDHEQKETKERTPFTPEEIKLVLKELEKKGDHFWMFAVRISAEIGLRLGDICEMEWNSFNKPGKAIVWTGKRDKRIEVPISGKLEQMVAEIPVQEGKYMFPLERSMHRDPHRRAALSVRFTRLVQKLGIEGKSFHDLRHMAATRNFNKADKAELAKKLAETLTLEQIAGLLGHSNIKTTKGYIH